MMPGMYVAEINKLQEENKELREKNIGLRLEKIVQGAESALVISKLLGAVDELRQNNAETMFDECKHPTGLQRSYESIIRSDLDATY